MLIRYDFRIKLIDFGAFIKLIAQKCSINHKLYYENDEFSLVINDCDEKILEFNELLKKVPYFLFLEDFNISNENTDKKTEFISCIFKTPFNLCDDIFDDLGLKSNEYERTKRSDFVMIANYELLQKAFVCDKNAQILLNSYEKPFVKLALKKLYKDYHNLPDFLYVSFANTKNAFNELKNSDELCFVEVENPLIIQPFSDTFCIVNNPYCENCSNAFNIDKLYFNIPSNKNELISMLKSLENGEKLLNNYENKFQLVDFKIEEKNIFALIKLANIIINSDILKVVPDTYTKGVRIDCEINEKGLNVAKFISSIMSYKLANAAMIEIGIFESIVAMLGKMNPDSCEICTKLMANKSFLNYNAFLNKHLKVSKWANCECFN